MNPRSVIGKSDATKFGDTLSSGAATSAARNAMTATDHVAAALSVADPICGPDPISSALPNGMLAVLVRFDRNVQPLFGVNV